MYAMQPLPLHHLSHHLGSVGLDPGVLLLAVDSPSSRFSHRMAQSLRGERTNSGKAGRLVMG